MYNFTCRVYWYQSGSPITEVFDAICEFIQKMSKNEFSQLSKVDIALLLVNNYSVDSILYFSHFFWVSIYSVLPVSRTFNKE